MIEYDTEALNSKFKRLIYTFAKKRYEDLFVLTKPLERHIINPIV